MPEKPVRIALVMGGGVSLGSFSSGALAELVRLLQTSPARRAGDVQVRPEIDVMTGASAGAMTLAILLRYLQDGAGWDEIARAQRECWVEGVGIDYPADDPRQLLPDLRDHRTPSLLRDEPIAALRRRHVERPFAASGQPSPLLGETVLVSFALSNLNGVDIRAPWQTIRPENQGGDDALVTTFFEDRIRFRFDKQDLAPATRFDERTSAWCLGRDPQAWGRLGEAATASGAFPAAFPPRRLRRTRQELGPLWPEQLQDADEFDFTYIDGGVFCNEPLKEAIELAAFRDAGLDPDSYERVFVLIDPHLSGTSASMALGFDHPLGLEETLDDRGRVTAQALLQGGYAHQLVSVLARTAASVAGQAAFRDWIKMARTNNRLEWSSQMQELLGALAASVGAAELPALAERVGGVLAGMYRDRAAHAPTGTPPAEAALARDRAALARGMTASLEALPDERRQLLVDMALLLRNVAGLRDKRRLRFVAITPWSVPEPRPVRLAGNFMGNFGGFFHRPWRAHDHAAGRWVAYQVLTAQIGDAAPLIGDAQPPEGAAARPTLPRDPDYQQVARPARALFEDVVHDHLENVVSAVGVPDWIDHAVASHLTSTLTKALGRSGTTRYLVLRILLPQQGWEDLGLEPTELCDTSPGPLEHEGGQVLETVIAATWRPDEPVAHTLSGPHLHEAELRVVRNRLLGSTLAYRVILSATPLELYSHAGRVRLITVPRPVGGGPVRVGLA